MKFRRCKFRKRMKQQKTSKEGPEKRGKTEPPPAAILRRQKDQRLRTGKTAIVAMLERLSIGGRPL